MKTINIFFLVFCVVLTAADRFDLQNVESTVNPRIIGGENAKEGQFPYQVSLRQFFPRMHYCGASILTNRFLLTAAHCAKPAAAIFAVVGAIHRVEGGVTVQIERSIPHPEWNRIQIINDIGLLKTATEIVFSDTIQPIALPKQDTESNTQVVLSGWGRNLPNSSHQPEILQFTEPRTISNEECIQRLRSRGLGKYIQTSVVCIMNKKHVGSCAGDSGGPLAKVKTPGNKKTTEIVGVVSCGIKGCAKGFPDMFTRVYSYVDWIEETIEKESVDS